MFQRLILTLFLALSMTAFVGCDSDDDDDPFLGVWEAQSTFFDDEVGQAFLFIEGDEITVYIFFEDNPLGEDCYSADSVEVISRDGDTWTIRDADGEESSATVRLDGDELVITSEGDTVRFDRSNRRVSTFTPECID